MQKKPEMLAKIAMQASNLYAESVKAFGESEKVFSLAGPLNLCSAKKDYFDVSCFSYSCTKAEQKQRSSDC